MPLKRSWEAVQQSDAAAQTDSPQKRLHSKEHQQIETHVIKNEHPSLQQQKINANQSNDMLDLLDGDTKNNVDEKMKVSQNPT